jgi:tetratricopeptide (TPR) repeat protein
VDRSAKLFAAADRALQAGDPAEAERLCRQAVALVPDDAEAHYRLGLALARRGDARAPDAYREALRLRPDHGEAHAGLGVALASGGKAEEGVAHLRQAVGLRPGLAKAHHNLGVALADLGKPEEAAASLREALRHRPDYPEAWYNLGVTLGQLGRRDEAVAAYREAVRLRPGYAEALNNLGLALTEAGEHGTAAVFLRQAARLRPDFAEAHNNLGLALAGLARHAEAEAAYAEALRLDPASVEAHTNLGSAYKDQGRLDEALASYELALWHRPDGATAHWNRALAWLQAGDFARGWPEYEWRWRRARAERRRFSGPAWDGGPLEGRTVLLWAEQGLGDTLQFVRYARLVRERGARVVLAAPGTLLPLLGSCPGVDQLVDEQAEAPPFDVQAPLLSLPGLLGTTLGTVPADVPYLAAEPARVARWRGRLAKLPGFRVGIALQGNPRHVGDRHRSVPLDCFAPLAGVPGVSLVSLQKGPGSEQVAALAGRWPVADLGDELDQGAAFVDTAAVVQGLDMVVTVDTAVAHLAGALGRPAWVALSAAADWRWLRGREDSPWYPTLRLFRQERPGEWGPVFARLAAALSQAADARPSRRRRAAA